MSTVLFDIDGTLMNSGGAGSRAMARTALQLLGVQDIPPIPVHGRTDFAIFSDLFSALKVEFESCYPAWQKHYHQWLEQELSANAVVRPKQLPGVQLLLDELKSSNWHSAIITGNSKHAAKLKLQAVGIEKYFVSGGYGDWSECRNQLAREAVEVCKTCIPDFDVAGSIMIGDTVHDVQCALSVNMFVIGVTTGGSSREELQASGASMVVDSLAELDVRQLSSLLML